VGNTSQAPQPDEAEIRRTLNLLHPQGESFEIRALGNRPFRTLHGFFTDIEKATQAVLQCVRRGAEGVYITLNPINPALLARANNRIVEAKGGAGTKDEDVIALRCFLVDSDPVRLPGISSNEAEHQAALDQARKIAAWLASCGFPEALIADSGNGAHLLYRIDLPTSDSKLLGRVLKALAAQFSNKQVKVDTSTSNAGQICKLYGTPARKGDPLPDRPHRLARILHVPDKFECVTREALNEIAAFADTLPDPPDLDADPRVSRLRAKLKERGLEVLEEEPYQEGKRWILRQCPFRKHHKEKRAAILIDANGAWEFRCKSEHCEERRWKDLREWLEQASTAEQQPNTEQSDESGTHAAFDGARLHPNGTGPGKGPAVHEVDRPRGPLSLPEICIRGTCAEWISTLEPRGEWPRAFLFQEWRMIHSMVMGRRAWYSDDLPRYPHCHDLLIGESGITHKSTSINRAARMIRMMRDDVLILDNISSIEGVLEQMDEKRRSTALIAAGEYSYLVATSKRQGTSNIIPMLNHAYDGVDPLTITKKKAPIIREPFVNMVAGVRNHVKIPPQTSFKIPPS